MGITPSLEVKIGKLTLQNPVIAASGTFGYGTELADLVNIEKLGAIVTKTITLYPRQGNETPRVLETVGGLLNSIGLQNVGLARFKDEFVLELENIKNVRLVVSLGGDTLKDYIESARILDSVSRIDAFELNVSCPNVKKGCMAIGGDKNKLDKLITGCKNVTDKPIIVKLSPNFMDIIELAKACEKSGADAVSLVNTFLGMAIDISKKTYYFKNKVAGLSGPAIKPMALRIVHDVCKNINIPVIGMGGIASANDALEFLIVGASAVQVGTATFTDPGAMQEIIKDLKKYCIDNNISDLNQVIASIK